MLIDKSSNYFLCFEYNLQSVCDQQRSAMKSNDNALKGLGTVTRCVYLQQQPE